MSGRDTVITGDLGIKYSIVSWRMVILFISFAHRRNCGFRLGVGGQRKNGQSPKRGNCGVLSPPMIHCCHGHPSRAVPFADAPVTAKPVRILPLPIQTRLRRLRQAEGNWLLGCHYGSADDVAGPRIYRYRLYVIFLPNKLAGGGQACRCRE